MEYEGAEIPSWFGIFFLYSCGSLTVSIIHQLQNLKSRKVWNRSILSSLLSKIYEQYAMRRVLKDWEVEDRRISNIRYADNTII